MGKEKASAALFDQLQTAIEGGEGEEIVGKVKVSIAGSRSSAHNTQAIDGLVTSHPTLLPVNNHAIDTPYPLT